ncbi:MAG: ABC transporter ATP-binding protein [Sphingobium sp.]
MIFIENMSKVYPTRKGPRTILDNVNMVVHPGEKIGILGRNGAGKSTMIRLISGAELPTKGRVTRNMTVSWPLAFGGAFQFSLTGMDNLRFISRIYDVDVESQIAFIDDFAELGMYLREPVSKYSAGMLARLAFAVSMIVEFDCFLIDEVISVGDKRFHDKCRVELFEKRGDRAMIFVSHDPGYISEHCDRAAVLTEGKLTMFDSVAEAYEVYDRTMA